MDHAFTRSNQAGYTGPFFKMKRKEAFEQSTLDNRVIRGPFDKNKDKRGLNTTDHVTVGTVSMVFDK